MVSDSPEDVFNVHSAISVIEKHAQEKRFGVNSRASIQERTGAKGDSIVVLPSGKFFNTERARSTPNLDSQEDNTRFDILQRQSCRFLPHRMCVLCKQPNLKLSKTHPYTRSILRLFTTRFYGAQPPANCQSHFSEKDVAKCTWNLLCSECNQCTNKIESIFEKRLAKIYKEGVTLLLEDSDAFVLRIWTYLGLAVNVDLYRAERDLSDKYFKQLKQFVNKTSEQHQMHLKIPNYVPDIDVNKIDLLFHFEKGEEDFGRFPCLYDVDLTARVPNCRVMIIYGQLPPLGLHWAFTLGCTEAVTAELQGHFQEIVEMIKKLHSKTFFAPKHTKDCRLVVQELRCLRKYYFVIKVGEHAQGLKMHSY